jgi:hypothetical protein
MNASRAALRCVSRTGVSVVLVSWTLLTIAAIPSARQSRGTCPPVIASLFPKNASIRGGSYTMAGPMGQGEGAADLPFEHPCVTSTRYPARVSVAITYYGGEMAEILKMQGDAADQQTIQNATSELERSRNRVKTETLAGGQIVYYDYTSECPAEGAAGRGSSNRPPIPNVRLRGLARTDNARLEVTLEGRISTDLAKTAVAEVFGNFKKAEFDKAK